jgi:hypothetical protein
MMSEPTIVPTKIEPAPPDLLVTLPMTADDGTVNSMTVHVQGLTQPTVEEFPWGPIIELYLYLRKKDDPPPSSGGGKCMTVTATNSDGSSFSYTYCPPPAPA